MLAKRLTPALGPYCRQYKSIACVFFFLTAHLPVQDVSGAAETHFGAAQITHFQPCYEHPKMLWPPIKMPHNKDPILILCLLLGQVS